MRRTKGRHSYTKGAEAPGRLGRLLQLVVVGAIVSLLSAGIASADNVQDDVVAGGNDTITAGGSTTVKYRITANNGDGQNGCNSADGSAATVTINAPAGVTATPGSLTFTSCGTDQAVVFSSSSVGDHPITVSVSDSGSGSYNTNPANFTLHVVAAPPPSDTTPPDISYVISGTLGDNGWYTSDVSLTWAVSEPESPGSLVKTGCEDQNITADQAATTYSCSASSDGGSSGPVTVTIKRDATKPTLNPSVSPNPVLLNGSATASPGASDNLSGIASASCGAVDTSSVGSKSVSCSATDNAGNSNSASASYSVSYKFVGFSQPVDNNGVLNVAKAGSAIPLKWRLLDASDSPVTSLSSVSVTAASLNCSLGTTADQLEEVAAGSSGLQNLGDGYYQFNWKTPTSYAKSCKTMNLDLGEGSARTALFQFTK